jgi:hypothetical protein
VVEGSGESAVNWRNIETLGWSIIYPGDVMPQQCVASPLVRCIEHVEVRDGCCKVGDLAALFRSSGMLHLMYLMYLPSA